MAQYIKYKLTNDTQYSPGDILGVILITGEKGKIEDENIFLDTFFEGLAQCLTGIKSNNKIAIDVIDEPYSLIMSRNEEGVNLEFGSQTTFISNLSLFELEIKKVLHDLITQLDDYCHSQNIDPLPLIFLRKYAQEIKGSGLQVEKL